MEGKTVHIIADPSENTTLIRIGEVVDNTPYTASIHFVNYDNVTQLEAGYNNYVVARRERWAEWRNSNLRSDRLMATIDSLANEVTCCGAEARDSQAWPHWGKWVWPNHYVSTSYEDEINFIKNWLNERIVWMDALLRYTPPEPPDPEPLVGDVNNDGQVTIADINLVVDIILMGTNDPETKKRADVNGDGEITIADVTYIINLILRAS